MEPDVMENYKSLEVQLQSLGLSLDQLPDDAALEKHYMLCQRLRQELQSGKGKMTFERFMQLALYEPGLGYYVNSMQKFGKHGDFITAPELSWVFGASLAYQCQQIIENLQRSSEICILEFGAGTAKLAVDILTGLQQMHCLPNKYLILEPSPELRQRQLNTIKRCLPDLLPLVTWIDNVPARFDGIVIANEVLDAMPVKRFIKSGSQVNEQCVQLQNDEFVPDEMPASDELRDYVLALEKKLAHQFAEGFESEINVWLKPWLKTLVNSLQRGVILLIDYGYPASEYYHEQRNQGTLICNFRHRAHANPYILVGLQDISAFVDFSAVANYASDLGMEIAGFNSQAQFLLANGLDEIATQVLENDPNNFLQVAKAIKQLTLPGEMGERFKVLALSKGFGQALRGFEQVNQCYRL